MHRIDCKTFYNPFHAMKTLCLYFYETSLLIFFQVIILKTSIFCEMRVPFQQIILALIKKDSRKFQTPCSSWPCQNGGKCIPNYEKGEFTCSCKPGFGGETCQTG